MVEGLADTFGSVRLLCLGAPGLPGYQREGRIEVFRFSARYRDLLVRATRFAQFVRRHAERVRNSLKLAVFRDPWGGLPVLQGAPGCRALFEVNALPSAELSYSRPGFDQETSLAAKLRDMERRCLAETTRVLCVSSVTSRFLTNSGCDPRKITVIPNVGHDVFFEAERQPCPVPELAQGRWFGYIGGLQPWQGVDFLVDAFALAAPAIPDARLLILHGDARTGTDQLRRRISRMQLDERVLIHSAVTQPEVAGILARLAFTAAPLAETPRNTVQGCCPVKMVESMAAGTPVIASDLAVCREWMGHESEGLLAPPGDLRAWAAAIRRTFTDADLRGRLAAGARRRAEQSFRWPVVHSALARLFREAAG